MPGIFVPEVYPEYSSAHVLTMEWVHGRRLVDESASVRREDIPLIKLAIACSLTQLLEDGFLHADPHAGNLLVTAAGGAAVHHLRYRALDQSRVRAAGERFPRPHHDALGRFERGAAGVCRRAALHGREAVADDRTFPVRPATLLSEQHPRTGHAGGAGAERRSHVPHDRRHLPVHGAPHADRCSAAAADGVARLCAQAVGRAALGPHRAAAARCQPLHAAEFGIRCRQQQHQHVGGGGEGGRRDGDAPTGAGDRRVRVQKRVFRVGDGSGANRDDRRRHSSGGDRQQQLAAGRPTDRAECGHRRRDSRRRATGRPSRGHADGVYRLTVGGVSAARAGAAGERRLERALATGVGPPRSATAAGATVEGADRRRGRRPAGHEPWRQGGDPRRKDQLGESSAAGADGHAPLPESLAHPVAVRAGDVVVGAARDVLGGGAGVATRGGGFVAHRAVPGAATAGSGDRDIRQGGDGECG
eukprot:ctg_70.g34